jgi:hypothetical protein
MTVEMLAKGLSKLLAIINCISEIEDKVGEKDDKLIRKWHIL